MFTLKEPRQKSCICDFYHTTTTYTPSILHLTLMHRKSLTFNALLSVRCYKIHLHSTYTTCTLPHGTSTGGGYYGIGEQNSCCSDRILYVPVPYYLLHTSKLTVRQQGEVCKMYAGECKILWNHLTLLKPLCINLLRTKSVRWQ